MHTLTEAEFWRKRKEFEDIFDTALRDFTLLAVVHAAGKTPLENVRIASDRLTTSTKNLLDYCEKSKNIVDKTPDHMVC